MEMGLRQTQEEVSRGWEEKAATREVVQSVGRKVKEEFPNLDQRLDGLLRMF